MSQTSILSMIKDEVEHPWDFLQLLPEQNPSFQNSTLKKLPENDNPF